ncbi:hypothetical protein NDU88_002853 [Pleurodeles waltl]|uniref:Uncharacterized protein n=1 Tax=Pleurodeles waltl TaxID=8319 RepID=A0AAV7QAI7_PLEWA|nr:hypothetical protein NDU88_002853 [Pleurodeles waltl]
MYWKAPVQSRVAHWREATLKWGQAQAVTLRREEARRPRKYFIAADWEVLRLDSKAHQEEAGDSQDTPS